MAVNIKLSAWQCILTLLMLFSTVASPQLILSNVDYNLPSSLTNSSESYAGRLFRREITFDQAAGKGCGHLGLLASENPFESPFTANSLADNGWSSPAASLTTDIPEDATPIFNDLDISTDPGNNFYYWWSQDQSGSTNQAYQTTPSQTFEAGTEYAATTGYYNNQMSPTSGMMLLLNNYGPRYMIETLKKPGPRPPLSQLSDVMWLQWKAAVNAIGDQSLISNIKYNYVHIVGDWDSRVVSEYCYQQPGQDLLEWPGRTYSMTAEDQTEKTIAEALLGMPVGNSIVFFLAQHREELGEKTVSKVRIWGKGGPDVNVMYFIEDAQPETNAAGGVD